MPENYTFLRNLLSKLDVTLVAVSKTRTDAEIMQLYTLGQRDFGENKVQELRDKRERLPKDIRWHMIGHLQSNKVKYIAPWIDLIQSIDSSELLGVVNKEGNKNNRVIPCLLQYFIAKEETKFGLDSHEIISILKDYLSGKYPFIRIDGIMAMATNTDDAKQISKELHAAKLLFDILKDQLSTDHPHFKILSMGMSSDYTIAVEEGSTMVRIGSLLFGERH